MENSFAQNNGQSSGGFLNNVMPSVSPAPSQPSGSMIAPSMPPASAVPPAPTKTDNSVLLKTIFLVFSIVAMCAFAGLFIWAYLNWQERANDVDIQIAVAVAENEREVVAQKEAEFTEREKEPYEAFTGPADYGQVTFSYPKTWSVYIDKDASDGGDFEAYFNPGEVNPISDEEINSLRFKITTETFDSVSSTYRKHMEDKNNNVSVETITIGSGTSAVAAEKYSGTSIKNKEWNGYSVIFKIRDKTVIFETDSVLFEEDFNKIISSITFNS